MNLTKVFLQQLDDEAELTRRALERVPELKDGWKPHEKSMPLGRLAHLVAIMPSWISMIATKDELDVKPKGGGSYSAGEMPHTPAALVKAHDEAVVGARQALKNTTEKFLTTPWKLLESGTVVSEKARYLWVIDNFTHLAHHRGQLTVYLRMNDVSVPAIYGPSADDHRF